MSGFVYFHGLRVPPEWRRDGCSENLATCSALHVWTANALASGTVPGATSVIVFVSPSDVLTSSRLAPSNTEDRSVQASVPRDRGRRSHPEVFGPRLRDQPEDCPKGPRAGGGIAGRSHSARRAPRAPRTTPLGHRFGYARCLRQADTRARSTRFISA